MLAAANVIVCTPQGSGKLSCLLPTGGLSDTSVALLAALLGAVAGAVFALGATIVLNRRDRNRRFRQLIAVVVLAVRDIEASAEDLRGVTDLAYQPELASDWW